MSFEHAIPHPRWRVPGWEDLLQSVRDDVVAGVRDSISHFSFYPAMVDLEVPGSYARRCSRLTSDLDFNIAMANEEAQLAANLIFYGRPYPGTDADGKPLKPDPVYLPAIREFLRKKGLLEERLGIKIEVGCVDWRSKEYNVVFSTVENRFYGKAPGEVCDWKLKWNDETRQYDRIPRGSPVLMVDYDPFESEVAQWAARYGDAFQCLPSLI